MNKNFTPQIIEVDQEAIDNEIKKNRDSIKSITSVLEKAESMLGVEPNIQIRKNLLNKGYQYLLDSLDEKLPFPNAPVSDNYRLMGIDPTILEKPLKAIEIDYINSCLSLPEINLELTEEGIETIKNKFTYSTQNETQNKMLKFANTLSEFLNDKEYEMINYCGLSPDGSGINANNNLQDKFKVVLLKRDMNTNRFVYVPSAQGIFLNTPR